MPQKIYNNVVGHKVYDNGRVVEDVTSVGLPTIEHPISTIKGFGMVMDVDVPDMTHLNSMEISIAHNNGVNCRYLADPGVHTLELRVARQAYNTARAEMTHEGMKVRAKVMRKSRERGNVEMSNPLGTTDKFSILRYEEEENGEVITLVDAAAGILRVNGKDYSNDIESILNR